MKIRKLVLAFIVSIMFVCNSLAMQNVDESFRKDGIRKLPKHLKNSVSSGEIIESKKIAAPSPKREVDSSNEDSLLKKITIGGSILLFCSLFYLCYESYIIVTRYTFSFEP